MKAANRTLAGFALVGLFSGSIATFTVASEGGVGDESVVTGPESTEPPTTEPPVTEPPTTEPPVTEPPTTEPPVTEPPNTEPPNTEPPVTEPPNTEPPNTEPPVTEPSTVANGIGGIVWNDVDRDGIDDGLPSEPRLSGVQIVVTALGADGAPGGDDDVVIGTYTTEANGAFFAGDLDDGSFLVTVVGGLPATYASTADQQGVPDGRSIVSLTGGRVDLTQDFGYSPPDTGSGSAASSISGTIYIDRDGDGVRGDGERAILGQRADLQCSGGDGRLFTADDLTASTRTDASGGYRFTDLPAGDCRIVVVDGITGAATNTADPDGLTDSTSIVTVDGVGPAGAQDFGYSGDNSVGNTVYLDLNGNGIDNGRAIDPAAADIVVTAVWAGLDGESGTNDDVAASATTDAAGNYFIAGLPDGQFTIEIALETLPVGTVPTVDPDGGKADGRNATELSDGEFDNAQDFGLAGGNRIGDTVWLDLDTDGVRDVGEPGIEGATVTVRGLGPDGTVGTADDFAVFTSVNAAGFYLVDFLPPGSYTVVVTGLPAGLQPTADPDGGADAKSSLALAPGEINLDQDFGFSGASGVGDTVFVDANANGVRDGGEAGVADLDLTVTSPGVDGLLYTEDDLATVVPTDANGHYQVTGLPSGSILVSYEPRELPDDLEPLSDADGGFPNVAEPNLAPGETNLDVDFAVADGSTIPIAPQPQPGGLTGEVFFDPNRNGRQDTGETGVAGVTVTLVGADGAVLATTTTDRSGVFAFNGLTPGVYRAIPVSTTLPSGTSIVTETDGVVDGTTTVTVVAGQVTPSGDFGVAAPAAVPPVPPTRALPRTGSSGVERMLEIALAALLTGLGLMVIRRRPKDATA